MCELGSQASLPCAPARPSPSLRFCLSGEVAGPSNRLRHQPTLTRRCVPTLPVETFVQVMKGLGFPVASHGSTTSVSAATNTV